MGKTVQGESGHVISHLSDLRPVSGIRTKTLADRVMSPIENSSFITRGGRTATYMYLEIGGKKYRWKGVPKHLADEVLKGESPGRAFTRNIKGKFPSWKEIDDAWVPLDPKI